MGYSTYCSDWCVREAGHSGDHELRPARPPLPPRRCRHYHGVPGCRCQVSGIAGKPHTGSHHCDEHDYTWTA